MNMQTLKTFKRGLTRGCTSVEELIRLDPIHMQGHQQQLSNVPSSREYTMFELNKSRTLVVR
jgi:hypothetical protein